MLARADAHGFATIDADDTVREVHNYDNNGVAYGYTKQRGLTIQLAMLSTPLPAPVIARARLRSGNTASTTGAGRMLAQANQHPASIPSHRRDHRTGISSLDLG